MKVLLMDLDIIKQRRPFPNLTSPMQTEGSRRWCQKVWFSIYDASLIIVGILIGLLYVVGCLTKSPGRGGNYASH